MEKNSTYNKKHKAQQLKTIMPGLNHWAQGQGHKFSNVKVTWKHIPPTYTRYTKDVLGIFVKITLYGLTVWKDWQTVQEHYNHPFINIQS